MIPDFSYEKKLWRRGFRFIAGADEVGRGAFAGPVVAAAVTFAPITNSQFPIFNENLDLVINDSKQLRPKQREIAAKWIKENALTWGIGESPVNLINRFGMAKATNMAFRKAIANANLKLKAKIGKSAAIDYLLVDAFFVPYLKGIKRKNQKAIIKGDTKSISIAAASIIAKVHRDKIMLRLSKNPKYKDYKWGKNKGYGTKDHRSVILRKGICRLHRKQFVRRIIF